jgi:sigma-E factor negative regulatory protein RseA
MTEQELERLSALVDDELPPNDIGIEVHKLSQHAEVRESWGRYHLIGDAMRRELGSLYNPSLVQTISQRLEDEPVILAPIAHQGNSTSHRKTWAGLAVAASLTAVAVVMAPQLINQEGSATQPTVAAQQPVAAQQQPVVAQQPESENTTYYVAQDGTRWELLKKPAVESRLNKYLVNHQERSPSSNIKGIMPYATFVSYDGNKQ